MIGLPMTYAVSLSIGGAIGALIYNIFSAAAGGMEAEVEHAN